MTKDLQLAVVDGGVLTEKDVMSSIDTVLQKLYETGNLSNATKVVNVMDRIGEVSGKAKAKLLFGMQRWYKETGQEEKRNDTFEDYMESETEIGNRAVTIKRYVRVWEYIENCTIPKEVQTRRMDDLIKISTVLSHGHEISKDQWKKLQHAANSSDVAETLREITGKAPRKSGLQIVLGRDGVLNAYKGNQKFYVGFLEVNSEDEVVKKVIQRIIDCAGIMEK